MTTAAPTTGAELAEELGSHGPVLDDQAKAAISGFVKNQIDTGIDARIDQQLQAGLADWSRDQKAIDGARPNLAPAQAKIGSGVGYNPRAVGAAGDGQFESMADMICAMYGEKVGNAGARQQMNTLRNAYSSVIPSEGGALIPEEFRAELLRVALSDSLVRSRARVVPMSAPRIKFPIIDSSSNASNVHGGITGYWSEESGTLTESSATFGAVTLDAQKLTAAARVPNELLSDSPISVQALINQTYPEALSWFEDIAFVRGSGVGEPLGFLTAGNTAQVSVSKETGQLANTIVWENIVNMFSRMLPNSLNSAVWVAHPNTFPELATMALSVGTGGAPVWLSNGVGGPPVSILGRPVIFCEKMETLGTAGDLAFVDFSYYLVGDRQQMTAMESPHVYFTTDSTAYRIIERIDGRPWLRSAITPNKGSTTLSPFVKLATRA